LNKLIRGIVLLLVCSALAAPSLRAQVLALKSPERVPFVRAGVFTGRSGSAIGPSAYLEINPLRWLGVCAFASQSHATSNAYGGKAQDWDFSTGVCVTVHAPEMKGFLISPFVQMGFQNNHERLAIPLGNGAFYRDGDDHMRRQWLVGPTIDRAIVKNGPRWAVRIARDFGKGPAANDAAGLYVVGGVIVPLDHPVELAKSFRRLTGFKSN
jgi:hypothetical protein